MNGPTPILLVGEHLVRPRVHAAAAGTAAVFTARSPLRELDNPNQDGVLIYRLDEARGVLAVADGLGGHADGAAAVRTTLEALADALCHADPAAELGATIVGAIAGANQTLVESGSGSGTTLAVVEIDHGIVRPFHVGDSDIVICGQRGRLRLRTVAHSPVGFALGAGMISELEAMHHAERHLVSNMVGAAEMRIEIGPSLRLRRRDTVLLCTDGLADNLFAGEIVEIMRCGAIERAAEELADLAHARMSEPETEADPTAVPAALCKPDDLTFIVYRPGGVEASASP